jgi:hypothetical protein
MDDTIVLLVHDLAVPMVDPHVHLWDPRNTPHPASPFVIVNRHSLLHARLIARMKFTPPTRSAQAARCTAPPWILQIDGWSLVGLVPGVKNSGGNWSVTWAFLNVWSSSLATTKVGAETASSTILDMGQWLAASRKGVKPQNSYELASRTRERNVYSASK